MVYWVCHVEVVWSDLVSWTSRTIIACRTRGSLVRRIHYILSVGWSRRTPCAVPPPFRRTARTARRGVRTPACREETGALNQGSAFRDGGLVPLIRGLGAGRYVFRLGRRCWRALAIAGRWSLPGRRLLILPPEIILQPLPSDLAPAPVKRYQPCPCFSPQPLFKLSSIAIP